MFKLIALFVFIICLVPNASLASFKDDAWVFNRQGVIKMQKKNIKGAIKDFEKACQLNPFNDVAFSNLACAHNNLGVSLVKDHNFQKAIEHFDAAKAQKPEDISVRLNLLSVYVTLKKTQLAIHEAELITKLRPSDTNTLLKVANAYQKLEIDTAAQTVFEKILDFDSNCVNAHASLGKLFYKIGNLREAKYHLSISQELDPENINTKTILNRVSDEIILAEKSDRYKSVHFALSCPDNFSEEWAEEVLNVLEEAYSRVGDKLKFYPSQRAQVIVFNTNDFTRIHDLPNWAGGLYDGKIRLPAPASNSKISKLKGAIFHEYTHHVVFLLSGGSCPIWLNEGLAQIAETKSFEVKSKTFDIKSHKDYLSLESLNVQFSKVKSQKKARTLYKLSLHATQKIINEFGWSTVRAILASMSEKQSLHQAILIGTGMSYDALSELIFES